MLLSHHQIATRDIKIANRVFEIVSQFKYLGTKETNLHLIHKEIKKRLNFDNVFYRSVQNLLSGSVWVRNLVSDIKGGA
jgi:hypothetical protein